MDAHNPIKKNSYVFLTAFFLLSNLYGLFLVLLLAWTGSRILDEFLAFLCIPIFYAIFKYSRPVYLYSLLMIMFTCSWSLKYLVSAGHYTSALITTTIILFALIVAGELIQFSIRKQQQVEEAYHALVDHSLQGLLIFQEQRIVFANQAIADMSGYTTDELLALSPEGIKALIHPDDRELAWQRQKDRIQGKSVPERYEIRLIHKNGEIYWVELHGNLIEYQGEPSVQTALIDITKRIQAREALKHQERLHSEAQRIAHLGHWESCIQTNRLNWSDETYRIFGLTPQAFDSTRDAFIERVHPEDREMLKMAVRDTLNNKIPYRIDHRIIRPDGDVRFVHERAEIEYSDEGEPIRMVGTVLDITERKRAEQALSENEETLRVMLNAIDDLIVLLTPDGRIVSANIFFEHYFDTALDHLIGVNVFSQFPPEAAAIREEKLNEAVRTKKTIHHTDKDDPNKIFDVQLSPIIDEKSNVYLVLIYAQDITERIMIEEQFHHSQKIEAITQLAGGIAHNLNNILTGVIGNLALAKMKPADETASYIDKAKDASSRAAELVSELLSYSLKMDVKLQPVDLNIIVDEVFRLVREMVDRHTEIEVRTDRALPRINADASQINSVLLNLCVNARDAIDDVIQGKVTPERSEDRFIITIETKTAEIDRQYGENHSYAKSGRYATVTISDNGSGMDSETKNRIFDPFFTTKELDKGTGLGLSSAYGTIQQHGGWIDVESTPGKGSSFSIYLPAIES